MHSDPEPQLTLSKWPFYLGDLLLLSIALTIAILADWQLTDLQVAYCVVAVALGSGLFCLPYIVEYRMRFLEVADDRAAQLRVLHRQLQQFEAVLAEQAAGLSELSTQANGSSTTEQLLSAALDQLTKLQQVQATTAEDLAALQAQFEQSSERLKQAIGAQDTWNALPQQFSEMQAELTQRRAALEALETRLLKIESTTARVGQAPKKGHDSGKPAQAKSRLLKRAIEDKQDSGSAAVSRILQAKAAPAEQKLASAEATPSGTSQAQAKTAAVEDAEPRKGNAASVDVPAAQVEPTAASAAVPAAPPEATEHPAPQEPNPAADLLFDALPEASSSAPKQRSKKTDSTVVVHALIGIGNKPYLRGSGGGLSWEQGVAMEFQEIGKWRWVAPAELKAAIEVQVYCNDEEPDQQSPQRLEPGGQLELRPTF
ncbi:MAG: hypothetical protein ACPGCT_01325 [Opitutales bacterium]